MAEEFPVVFALYPRVTQLDFTGAFEVFARLPGAKCTLASASGGDLEADGGIVFAGVRRLAEVHGCALICVPGGFGTIEAMEDQESLRKTQSAMRQGQSRAARRWPGACEGDRQEASV